MFKHLVFIVLLGGLIAGCQSTHSTSTPEVPPTETIAPAEPADTNAPVVADVQEQDQEPATNLPVEVVEEEPPEKIEQPKEEERNKFMLLMKTSMGDIKLELDGEKAPKTVENFLSYVESGHYDGTIFHRVINGFMIQGGGFDASMSQKPAPRTVENEAKNGLKNVVGSIAMARTPDPHSASAQFFINVNDNANLDYPSFDGWGYAVFGKVVEGMDVVNQIKEVATQTVGPYGDVPVEPIVIHAVSVVEE